MGMQIEDANVVSLNLYSEVADALGIDKPPTFGSSGSLASIGLAGLYDHRNNTILVADTLLKDKSEMIVTIVHELSHFILHKCGYKDGAHGWPFLALCSLLSVKYEFNWCIIMNSNIANWSPAANAKNWREHFFIAQAVFMEIVAIESWADMGANELATMILEHKTQHVSLLPKSLSLKLHAIIARTDGQLRLLYLSGFVFVIAGFILLAIDMTWAGLLALVLGFSFVSVHGYYRDNEVKFMKAKTYINTAKQQILHTISIFFPWSKH